MTTKIGSESILVRVQAGWDDVSDVLYNQFLKAIHRDAGRVVVSTTRKAFLDTGTMVDDGGCLEAGSDTLL